MIRSQLLDIKWQIATVDRPAPWQFGESKNHLFVTGGSSGSATTGNWVTDGMTFFLVDSATGQTLATYTAHLQPQ